MPRLDLILLPLLGGYLFIITFNLTKYYHLRLERQKLIYNSLVFAVLLTFLAYLLDFFILKLLFPQCREIISGKVSEIMNYNTVSGLKHSILIFIISWPLAKILNFIFKKKFAFDYTIKRWGSQLDRLIWFSLTEKKDENKLLMVTTKGNKVYIGYINKLSEPIGESFITIIPNFSGYRNKENLQVEITTSYTNFIQEYITKNKQSEIGEKLGIIVPVNEILFVSKFDTEIFGRLNENIQTTKDEENIFKKTFKFLSELF